MNVFKKAAAGVAGAGIVLGSLTFTATSAHAASLGCTGDSTSVTCSATLPSTADLASELSTALASYDIDPATLQALAQQFEAAMQSGFDPAQVQAAMQQFQTALQDGLDPAKFEQVAQQVQAALQNAGLPTDPARVEAAFQAFVTQLQNGFDPAQLQAAAQQVATALQNAGLPLDPADAQAAFAQLADGFSTSAAQLQQAAQNIATAAQNGLDPAKFAAAAQQLQASMAAVSKKLADNAATMQQALETIAAEDFDAAQIQQAFQAFQTALQNAGLPTDPATIGAELQAAALEGAGQFQAAAQQVAAAIKNGADPAKLQQQLTALQQQLQAGGLNPAQIQSAVQNAVAQLQSSSLPTAQILPTLIKALEQGADQATSASGIDFAAFNQSLDTLIPAVTQLGDSLTAPGSPTAALSPVLDPVLGGLGL